MAALTAPRARKTRASGVPAERAATKTASLLQKPEKGGMPERDNVARSMKPWVRGIHLFSPPILKT